MEKSDWENPGANHSSSRIQMSSVYISNCEKIARFCIERSIFRSDKYDPHSFIAHYHFRGGANLLFQMWKTVRIHSFLKLWQCDLQGLTCSCLQTLTQIIKLPLSKEASRIYVWKVSACPLLSLIAQVKQRSNS